MALTRVQAASALNTGFASSVAVTITPTSGNILLAAIEADTVAANGITVTDNHSNTWTRIRSISVASTFDLEIWWAKATTSTSTTVTATDNGGGVDSIICIEEWSGSAVTSPTDGSNTGSGVGTALADAGYTTTNANDLIWCAGVVALGANDLSAGSGFSNLTQNHTTFSNLGICSKVVSSTGSYAGSLTSSGSASWGAASVAIKQAAAAGNTGAGFLLVI